jgi:hypothetical protein
MDLYDKGLEVVDWNHLTEGNDQWQVLVKVAMNFRVPQNIVKFLSS